MYKLVTKKPVFTITNNPIVVTIENNFPTYLSMVNSVSRHIKSLPESAFFEFVSTDDPLVFNLNLVNHE